MTVRYVLIGGPAAGQKVTLVRDVSLVRVPVHSSVPWHRRPDTPLEDIFAEANYTKRKISFPGKESVFVMVYETMSDFEGFQLLLSTYENSFQGKKI